MASREPPVEFSVLSPDGLAASVLSRYALPGAARCLLFSQGVNDTYRVLAGAERYFLRVYTRGWRSRSEIEAELELLDVLARRGQPVSRPLPRSDGRLLTRVAAPEGARYAVLFSDAPGRPPDFQRAGNCRRYGELVAGLHRVADRHVPVDDRRFALDLEHLIDEPLASLSPLIAHRAHDLDYLRGVGADAKAAIEGLLRGRRKPAYGFCHGDHHGGNVHEDADGNLVLFDFDCYGYGHRAYDLSVFRWSAALRASATAKGRAAVTRRFNAFLDGYETRRSLSDAERQAIDHFVVARHLWLGGLHARLSRRFGLMRVGDPYLDFVVDFVRGYVRSRRL